MSKLDIRIQYHYGLYYSIVLQEHIENGIYNYLRSLPLNEDQFCQVIRGFLLEGADIGIVTSFENKLKEYIYITYIIG